MPSRDESQSGLKDVAIGEQSARGTTPRGLQDEKLQQLKYDLHWCLSKNDWWFSGAGIILGGALSWMTGSIKPFAAAAILAPAADWAYGRAVCSEYEQAYSAYRKQRLEEYKEHTQELREVLKLSFQQQRLAGPATARAQQPQQRVLVGNAFQPKCPVPQRMAPVTAQTSPQQPWHQLARPTVAMAASSSDLQVTSEQVGPCCRRLTVEVPKAVVRECFEKTVEDMRNITGNLAGFRRDKIPLSMLITQCGGQAKFKIACIEEVLLKGMELVMSQIKDPVVPGSERVASNVRELEGSYDPGRPLTFKIEYDTVPPVTWKRSYKDIEISVKDTGNYQGDLAAADHLIRQYLKDKGHSQVAAGRGLKQGDTAIVDLKFTEVGSTLPLPGLSADKARFDTDVDPFGLTKHLTGIQVGESRSFRITIPDDYPVDLWQGMEVNVEVKMRELFTWVLPEFDDAFVKEHFPKFESAEEMKRSLLATTAMERLKELDQRMGNMVQKAVVECVDIPALPDSIVMDMGATMYRAMLLEMIQEGRATREEVDAMATEEMVLEYTEKRRADLEDLCKFNIAADDIYAREGLTLEEEDVKAEVQARIQQYKAQQLDYDEAAVRDQVVDTFKHVKVVEWLKDTVKRNIIPFEEGAPAPAGAAA